MTPYNVAQQAPTPTSYGPPPYGQSLNPYEQNPYTVPSPHATNISQQQTFPPPPPPTRRQARLWPIIGILVAVLLVVSSIGVFAFFAQKTTNNSITQVATSVAISPTSVAISPTPEAKLSYSPYKGTLVLNDPLRDNSKGYNWQNDTDATPPSCSFVKGVYHAKVNLGYYYPCTAQTTDFNNSIYEVQMTVIQGDCGAIMFRNDSADRNFYYFRVCQDGTSALFIYKDKKGSTLVSDHSNTAIHTGLNQPNLVAVVAQGSTLELYVNQQKFDTITDSAYSHGRIGVAAEGFTESHSLTEVAFSDVKVWKL